LIIILVKKGVVSVIKNIIIHGVEKELNEPKVDKTLKGSENPINEKTERLSSELRELFRNTGLYTGGFTVPVNDDADKPYFERLLNKYYSDNEVSDFVKFSHSAAEYFIDQIESSHNSASTKGGYLWFNHYEHHNEYFLSVVLLRNKIALSIKDLDIETIKSIDLDKLHMAARINLSNWINGQSQRYISFKIGRASKGVTDYFSKFIGCDEHTDSKKDTIALREVINDFVAHHDLSDDQKREIREVVFDRAMDAIENEEPLLLKNLSDLFDVTFAIEEDKKGEFLAIAQNEPYELSDEIRPDKGKLRTFTRFSGKNKWISLSIEAEAITEGVIEYNNGILIVRDVPNDIKKELEQRS